MAALELPAPPPSELFGEIAQLPPAQAAEFVVRTYLSLLDDPRFRDAILALVRSAVAEEQAASMLREFVSDGLLVVVAQAAAASAPEPGPSPELRASTELRASLVAAQLIGIAMLRHVLGVEWLSGTSTEDLVSVVAPVVARYLE